MGKKLILTVCLGIFAGNLLGQSFIHSLYNYTPNRVNPAYASSNNFQKGRFVFRNQSLSDGVRFLTSYAEYNYPFFNQNSRRSGVALSLTNDHSYGNNIYSYNQISGSYAFTIPLNKLSELSLGINANFQSKSLNTQQLNTGSQYVEYFGFDNSLPSGENLSIINKNYVSFTFGTLWQKVNRYGKPMFTAGYALHHLNRPDDSFYEGANTNPLPFISVITGSATYFENYMWHLEQTLMIRHTGASTEIVSGPLISYALGDRRYDAIKSMVRYSSANNIMIGAVYQTKNFELGGSYDINIFKNNVSNQGTFEIILAFKKLRRAKRKSNFRYSKNQNETTEKDLKPESKKESQISKIEEESDQTPIPDEPLQNDTIKVKTSAGLITYLPHELENLNYNFHFDFDDIRLSAEDERYIREMTQILNQNDKVKVKIIGHTDNKGTEEYNRRLSFGRAKTIGLILVENGIPKNKIKLVAKGESEPIASNKSKAGRAENRRVEMQLIYD